MTIEVCVDSYEMALMAQKNGASRVELCSSLIEGGITPALSLIQRTCTGLKIPVYVMIRPRAGDFLYSSTEFGLMKNDIVHAKEAGASGVVFGILNADGSIDSKRTKELTELARPMRITFHRAFDMASDPFLALEEIISIGIENILTSGQRQVAEDGLEMIRELVKRAGDRISIMAGGGINSTNVLLLHEAGVKKFHFTSRKIINGNMHYRNEALVAMGGLKTPGEYEKYVFDEIKISNIISAFNLNQK